MKHTNCNRYLAIGISLCSALSFTSFKTLAQDAILEEVIVVAQKRSQRMIDVAASVTAVTGDTFLSNGGFGLEELNNLTAGIQVLSGGGAIGNQNIVLRGTGNGEFSASFPPRVPVYFDEGLAQPGAVFLTQFDVGQFELLRGPQGSLFGKSSPTGVLSIHTKDPDLNEVEGYALGALTEHDGINGQAGVSVPIVERELAIRIAGVYDEADTQDIESLAPRGPREPSSETLGVRLVTLWEPNDHFQARLMYQYIDQDAELLGAQEGGGNLAALGLTNAALSGGDRATYSNESVLEQEWHIASMRLNYAINDFWDVTSVSFYQQGEIENQNDFDQTYFPNKWQQFDAEQDNWSQELRLSGSTDIWEGLVGLYYAEQENRVPFVQNNGPTAQAAAALAVLIPITTESDNEEISVFSHNTFQATDRLDVIVGLRYSEEDRNNPTYFGLWLARAARDDAEEFSFVQDPSYDPAWDFYFRDDTPLVEINPITPVAEEFWLETYKTWTGSLKLQYALTPDSNVYAGWERGARAGANNLVRGELAISIADTPSAYLFRANEETSDNFEIGYKGSLWEGRGQLTVAAYYQLYEDFQFRADDYHYYGNADITDPSSELVMYQDGGEYVNTPEAVSMGVDVELTALLTENWFNSLAASFNQTEIQDGDGVPCTTDNGGEAILNPQRGDLVTCDFSGEQLGEAPKWSMLLVSEYTMPLQRFEWFARGRLNYNGERESALRGIDVDSHAVVDVFTGIRDNEGSWEAQLWIKNLFDDDTVVTRDPTVRTVTRVFVPGESVDTGLRNISVVAPRTIGASIRYYF